MGGQTPKARWDAAVERPVFAGTDSGSGSGDEDLEGKMNAEDTPGLAYEWWHPDEFPGGLRDGMVDG